MASDPTFDKLDALLAMVPRSLLKCPECQAHGEDDFRLTYRICFTSYAEWDGPSKILTADYQSEELVQIEEFSIDCMCGHNFPIPEGWRVANPQKTEKKKVSREKSDLRKKIEAAEADEKAMNAELNTKG